MEYNKYMLSTIRGHRERIDNKKNPINLIKKELNFYHSIDNMDATDEEKDWAKRRLRGRLYGKIERFILNDSTQNRFKAAVQSKEIWNDIKQSLE